MPKKIPTYIFNYSILLNIRKSADGKPFNKKLKKKVEKCFSKFLETHLFLNANFIFAMGETYFLGTNVRLYCNYYLHMYKVQRSL